MDKNKNNPDMIKNLEKTINNSKYINFNNDISDLFKLNVAWAKSNLNKKSEYFDADTLESETKKYNEKQYSKK